MDKSLRLLSDFMVERIQMNKIFMQVIILAARNQISVSNYNSQMTPIHGKPAISWVIDLYSSESDVLVVMNSRNKILQNYLKITYPNINCVLVNQDEMYEKHGQNSILTSLYEGVSKLSHDATSLEIVLGDTYCKNSDYNFPDFIVTADGAETSEKWCLVEKDNDDFLKNLYDKEKNIDTQGKQIVTGIYHFSDIFWLRNCLVNEIKEKHSNISNLLSAYNKKVPIKCVTTTNWLDFGHRSGILKAQKQFYNSRNFNSISVDNVTNILTKSSEKKQKLSDEYLWYKEMPISLQSFVPRVFSSRESENLFEIDMENYGYPPLSELWLYGDYDFDLWQMITKKLVDVRLFMNKFSGELDQKNYEQLYVSKFFDRLSELKNLDSYWKNLLLKETIKINGEEYKNLLLYEEKLRASLEKIARNAKTSVMHGDYCFSNILFDTQDFVCKLIDPRGRLLDQTIYGDSRYDFAKLRHSLVGNYDYIVHGAYFFSDKNDEFSYKDGCQEDRTALSEYFDSLLVSNGYDINEIKLIEATLFLSMIPLHTDSFEQQKIFYIKGIQKLNECMGES